MIFLSRRMGGVRAGPHKMTEFARVKGRRSGIRGKGRCLCEAANAVSIDYTTNLRGETI
jgi:hypothetical protein